jgi:hypothetical protein
MVFLYDSRLLCSASLKKKPLRGEASYYIKSDPEVILTQGHDYAYE